MAKAEAKELARVAKAEAKEAGRRQKEESKAAERQSKALERTLTQFRSGKRASELVIVKIDRKVVEAKNGAAILAALQVLTVRPTCVPMPFPREHLRCLRGSSVACWQEVYGNGSVQVRELPVPGALQWFMRTPPPQGATPDKVQPRTRARGGTWRGVAWRWMLCEGCVSGEPARARAVCEFTFVAA